MTKLKFKNKQLVKDACEELADKEIDFSTNFHNLEIKVYDSLQHDTLKWLVNNKVTIG